MKLFAIACLALAATACTSIDDIPANGNANFSIGDDGSYEGKSVFGAAGSYIQVFIAKNADADTYSAEGDPRITFMLDVGDTHAPDVIPSLTLDDDMQGPRLDVQQNGTVSRFAKSGTVDVEFCRWDETTSRLIEVIGEINATLEDGDQLVGSFTSVRERHSGV